MTEKMTFKLTEQEARLIRVALEIASVEYNELQIEQPNKYKEMADFFARRLADREGRR